MHDGGSAGVEGGRSASAVVANLTEEEYKEQRQQYRVLLDELQEKAETSGMQGVDPDNLRMLMMQANQLFTNVRRPREAAMDAQFLKQVSQLAALNIRASCAALHHFQPLEWAVKLKSFLVPEKRRVDSDLDEDAWKKLGSLAAGAMRPCYGVHPHLAGLQHTKVPRAPAAPKAPRVKDKEAEKTYPIRVTSARAGEEVQTEEVSRIYSVLKKKFRENSGQPLCFYSFVINPDSFVLTMENIFHTSFLVRDQHALITLDADQLPVIAPDKAVPGAQQPSGGGGYKQTEVSMDVETFHTIVKAFDITEPMIPPRPASSTSAE